MRNHPVDRLPDFGVRFQDRCRATSQMTPVMRGGAMRGEVPGVERGRRWNDEAKLAVVSASGVKGATVTRVARGGCGVPARRYGARDGVDGDGA